MAIADRHGRFAISQSLRGTMSSVMGTGESRGPLEEIAFQLHRVQTAVPDRDEWGAERRHLRPESRSKLLALTLYYKKPSMALYGVSHLVTIVKCCTHLPLLLGRLQIWQNWQHDETLRINQQKDGRPGSKLLPNIH